MLFLGMHKRPEFVHLHKTRMNISHALIGKATRRFPDGQQPRKNRALMRASDARHGANTHTLKQERGDLRRFFSRDVVASKRLLARSDERGVSRITAVSLNPQSSVGSKRFSCPVLASQAGHRAFPLVFLRG
jgi:hypothetical protein